MYVRRTHFAVPPHFVLSLLRDFAVHRCRRRCRSWRAANWMPARPRCVVCFVRDIGQGRREGTSVTGEISPSSSSPNRPPSYLPYRVDSSHPNASPPLHPLQFILSLLLPCLPALHKLHEGPPACAHVAAAVILPRVFVAVCDIS